MEFPGFVFLRDSCSHVTKVGGTHVCETRAISFHEKRRRLCGCNPAILLARCLPHIPTTTGIFLVSWADLLRFPFTEVHAFCHTLSCHSCLRRDIL